MLDLRLLDEGRQTAEEIGESVSAWLGAARETLELALYDIRVPGPVGDALAATIATARERGVQVRIAIHDPEREPPEPILPPQTKPDLLRATGAQVQLIDGDGDLMHHKFAIRDGAAIWTGSMNWTLDSWTRQENVIVTAESAALARAYGHTFDELWRRGRIRDTGDIDHPAVRVGDALVRPWFCPGRGRELAHRIAARIDRAERRVRIASPVLTSAPVLAALAEVLHEGRIDATGVVDRTQTHQALRQWRANAAVRWKAPVLEEVLAGLGFRGKRSRPYRTDTPHDFMHAKVTVVDDALFVGSYNLSRSGEDNAENVLEIEDRVLADRVATWIDAMAERFGPAA
jgi:phosphatidylserine/phosphatidylglycerophosphate/cardiolipin synthase-like enzyme